MDLDTARLRAFLQVNERGTVAAAAAALGYTAPAVSQQIAKLEAQLGSPLFDRVGGRLRLSGHGAALLPIARQILDLTNHVAEPLTGTKRRAHVVIAGFASALRTLALPALSSRLARTTTFDVREAEDEVALRDLRLGDIDIALTQEYDGAPTRRSDRLTFTPLLNDRLRLIAPPEYPTSVRLEELAETGWLVNGAGTRCEEATQRILQSAGIVARIAGRIADNQTLLALVAAGHGATITPQLVIGLGPNAFTVARVELGVTRTIFGVTRTPETSRLEPILDQLRRSGRTALRRQRSPRP